MIKILKRMTKREVLLVFISVVLITFNVWLDLRIPDYMSEITRLIQLGDSNISSILIPGFKMLLCAFGAFLCAIIVGYLAAWVSSSFSCNLRKSIFEKVEDFGMEEVKKFKPSSLITRTTNDVTQIEMLIAMGLQMIMRAPIMAIWAISKIINKNFNWSMIVGVGVLLLVITIIFLMITVLPKFKKIQKLIDSINGVTRENLTGIRVIRAFNADNYQQNRFENINRNLTNTQLFTQRMFALLNPVMNIIMHFLTLGIYFIGAIMIEKASMGLKITLFSDMVVFTSYGMQVIMSFLMLAMIFMIWPRASISASRINEVLDTDISIIDGNIDEKGLKEVGSVEFKNVSFKYSDADEYVLKDISFKANKGDVVAFIGSTGSGKSTLINLVPRFYDVTSGEVLIDGVNVKNMKQKTLHNIIGYVSQKAFMFTGSVKDNVGYGDNGNKNKEIEKAIEVAQASDFVSKLEGGISAHIARGGTNISGGQKQRLSIARAMARNPEIYIFDDSFSALDYKTDLALRKALKKYTKDATILIVAQRIGTIINADKIVVLDKGRCVGMGTHKELLNNCEVYKEIALSQLSKEELENA